MKSKIEEKIKDLTYKVKNVEGNTPLTQYQVKNYIDQQKLKAPKKFTVNELTSLKPNNLTDE